VPRPCRRPARARTERDAARHNGFVDVVHPVGGQEEQAVEVLEHAQEHADDRIHRHVVLAPLDIDVGLVDQHHRAPALGARQRLLERAFHLRDIQSELAGVHAVERPADDFRVHLGGQRLAHARRPCAQHGGTARLAGHDVVHQHVHLGGQDVDQVGLFRRQHQLLLHCGLVGIGRHVVHVHPQMLVQVEVEHEHIGMHRQLREQTFGHCIARRFDLVFRLVAVALRRLAQIGAKDVARCFEQQRACRQDGFVIDQAGRAAAGRQHDLILARPVGVAVGGTRVFRVETGAGGRELFAVARAPLDVACGHRVAGGDQRRRFLQEALGRQHLAHRLAGDVRAVDADDRGSQRRLHIGLQLDEYLARLFVVGRRVVEPTHHPGQWPGDLVGGEQPAADGTVGQMAGECRHQLFQVVAVEAAAVAFQRVGKRGQRGRALQHRRAGVGVEPAEEAQRVDGQPRHRHLHPVAVLQLVAQAGQIGKGVGHRLDLRRLYRHLHRRALSG
jgi:hypothetical protein